MHIQNNSDVLPYNGSNDFLFDPEKNLSIAIESDSSSLKDGELQQNLLIQEIKKQVAS